METLTNNPVQVQVADQLVEIDNLINALNYLREEAETKVLSSQQAGEQFREYLNSDSFFRKIRNYIRNRHLPTISRHVAEDVKADINNSIETYILSKIDERVERALAARNR